jgi:curved DNA-binding protein CbpA
MQAALDLYKVLGVTSEADKPALKKAYRNKSMTTHPDKGGTPEKFALVKKAYDTLSDDAKRRKYDDTGEIDEDVPDNKFSDIGNIIANVFNGVLQACAKEGRSPLELDMVESMKQTLSNQISELQKQKRIMQNVLEVDKKLQGRFRKKKKDDNLMENIIRFRIRDLSINLTRIEKQIADSKEAKEFLSDYSFRFDKPKEEDDRFSGIRFNFMSF